MGESIAKRLASKGLLIVWRKKKETKHSSEKDTTRVSYLNQILVATGNWRGSLCGG